MSLFDLLISPAYAQAAPAGPAPAGSFMSSLLFPIALIAIMYFMMIRPQMKRAKEHKAMLEKLAVGDEILTSGGIAGTVRALGDSFVTVEIANGVQVRVQRGAIGNVLPKGSLKAS